MTPASRMPHGTIRSNQVLSGFTFSEKPCMVTPLATRMPIAASLRSSRRWPALDGRVLGAVQPGVELLVVQPGVEVQREPAERGPLLDRVAQHPHAAAALDPGGLHAELGADVRIRASSRRRTWATTSTGRGSLRIG